MKKSMILLGMLAIGYANAQEGKVGINMEKPNATLNVKTKDDAQSPKNLELENQAGTKLMTVLNNGNVGIGTQTPTQKLDVMGKVKITDGTQGSGKVLTSDGLGNASWAALGTPGNLITQYRFTRVGDIAVIGYHDLEKGNAIFTREVATSYTTPISEIPSSIVSTDGEFINFAKGKYLIFINHDVGSAEYCHFVVRRKSDNSVVYGTAYGEWLNSSFLLSLEKDDSIYFELLCFAEDNDPRSNPNPSFYIPKHFYSRNIIQNIVTILQLH